MGVALNSTLQDFFSEGSWAVRPARSEKQVQVQAYLSSLELSSYPDKSLQGSPWLKKLSLLVWQLTLYSLWFERNVRIHKQIFRSHSQIEVGMDRTIKNRIHSFRGNNPATTSLMMQFWLRSPH
ncbi:hypothetical protein YC2023_040103 [Brassica napus]